MTNLVFYRGNNLLRTPPSPPHPNSQYPYDPGIGAVDAADNEASWAGAWLGYQDFWNAKGRGSGVKVALLDSGLDATHPAFSHANIKGFVDIDQDRGTITTVTPHDTGWHGTHCAGILCGSENTGVFRGIAPDVDLYVGVTLNGFDGSVVSVQKGLEWALDRQCKIISLSFGWPGVHDVWADIVKTIANAGAIIFAGIGNEYHQGADTLSPANYPLPNIVSVGAHDIHGNIWHLSGGGDVNWPSQTAFGNQHGSSLNGVGKAVFWVRLGSDRLGSSLL